LEHEDDDVQPITIYFNTNDWKGKSNSYNLADYEITADQLREYAG
jgi:hypothetical protein